MGEYDNGSAAGKGRTEYIWLPTDDGQAIPIGIYRNGKFFAIHSDHLGTPRLMTNEARQVVWQWPYSAFGSNKPTGILKVTDKPKQALTNQPVLLKATAATELNLRFPGQMEDVEAGSFYNYFRQYDPRTGRYTQTDPIGLYAASNRFGYTDSDSVGSFDPYGLAGEGPKNTKTPPLSPTGGRSSYGQSPAFMQSVPLMGGRSGGGGNAPFNFSPDGAGRTGAFNEAKRNSGVPTSQQPSEQRSNTDRMGRPQPGKQYDFDVPMPGGGTQRVTIRDDAGGHNFGTGNAQNRGPHFNDMCGRHYDY